MRGNDENGRNDLQKPIKKYSMVKIDSKYIKKLNYNKKKLFFRF